MKFVLALVFAVLLRIDASHESDSDELRDKYEEYLAAQKLEQKADEVSQFEHQLEDIKEKEVGDLCQQLESNSDEGNILQQLESGENKFRISMQICEEVDDIDPERSERVRALLADFRSVKELHWNKATFHLLTLRPKIRKAAQYLCEIVKQKESEPEVTETAVEEPVDINELVATLYDEENSHVKLLLTETVCEALDRLSEADLVDATEEVIQMSNMGSLYGIVVLALVALYGGARPVLPQTGGTEKCFMDEYGRGEGKKDHAGDLTSLADVSCRRDAEARLRNTGYGSDNIADLLLSRGAGMFNWNQLKLEEITQRIFTKSAVASASRYTFLSIVKYQVSFILPAGPDGTAPAELGRVSSLLGQFDIPGKVISPSNLRFLRGELQKMAKNLCAKLTEQ